MKSQKFAAFVGVMLLSVGAMGCAASSFVHRSPMEPGAPGSTMDAGLAPVAAPTKDKLTGTDAKVDWRMMAVEPGLREIQGAPPEWSGTGLQMQVYVNGTVFSLDGNVPFLVEIGNAGPKTEMIGLNYKGHIFSLLVMQDLPDQRVDMVRLDMGVVPPAEPRGSIDLAGTLELKPGEFKRYLVGWPCERVQGVRVSPGTFRAKAVLASYDHTLASNEVHFRLQAK